MVAKSGIRLLYISKFMKVFMDIYGENCCRINNLQIRKKIIHIFDLTLVLRKY